MTHIIQNFWVVLGWAIIGVQVALLLAAVDMALFSREYRDPLLAGLAMLLAVLHVAIALWLSPLWAIAIMLSVLALIMIPDLKMRATVEPS